jgi:pimeloyl-ACP methyl ester carboxylesterase
VQPGSDAVLLLHGQPGNGRDWDAVRAALGGRAWTLALDRPGWDGRSRPLDLPGNARAALAALDAHRIERATVVGHSLGGAIAAWLAAEHPNRVGSLVLAAPSANCESLNRLDELLATPLLGTALATTAFATIGLGLTAGRVRRRISTRFGLPETYLRAYAQTLLSPRTWHSFSVEQKMLVRDLPALEERLSAISAPTRIVVGTADRIVSPSSVRALATRIPPAELIELDHASHLLLQERPAEMAELVVAAGQDSPGSG